MSALQRHSCLPLTWRRRLAVPLVLVAIAVASLAGAAPGAAEETPTPTEAAADATSTSTSSPEVTPSPAETATPEPPLGPIDLSYDVTCAPDTFRPDEWVPIECITRFVNEGQNVLTDISVGIGRYSGSTPSYFFMWSAHDGEFAPVGAGALSFEHRDLGPGEAAVSSIVLLLKMGEGAFETELNASVRGQAVDSVPIRFVATAGAAEPPRDLVVTSEPLTEVGEEPQPTATYRTIITNQGSSEVTDLTLTERYTEGVALVSADPAPASQSPGVQIASWNLASFGRGSLPPGESLVLRTTYGPAERADCGWASSGFVVEATVDGQEQRYGARPIVEQLVGECAYPQIGGGGELPTTLGRGGDGPAPPGGGASWAVAALAGVGVLLIGMGLTARRRALSR